MLASDTVVTRRGGLVGGAVLGSLCLWLAFRDVDWRQLWAAIASLHVGYALGALGCVIAALVTVVLRWRELFTTGRNLGFWNLLQATVVGQALNIALPIRVGEIGRWQVLVRAEGLPRTAVLATLVVEKGLDLLTLGLVTGLLVAASILPQDLAGRAGVRAGLAAAALFALWGLGRLRRVWLPSMKRLATSVPERWRGGLGRAIDESGAVVTALGTTWRGLTIAALSLAVVALSALANYLLMRAFGLTLPFQAALVLFVVLQVGAVPPSLPGRLGVFNYLTVLTLSQYGVAPSIGLSYSVALYVVAMLSKLVWGTFYLVRGDLWREMRTDLVA